MSHRTAFSGYIAFLAALTLLAAAGRVQAQAILANDVVEPRTFGYVVGDRISREVHLSLAPGYRLDAESLPEAGRVNRWLDFAAPEIYSETDRRGRHYRLVLSWQLRNAPAAPETIAIPQVNFRVASRTQAAGTLVPALRINAAPLTSAVALDRITPRSLQQDQRPTPLPLAARRTRLAWTGAALLGLLAFAGWRRGLLSFGARGNLPFARALHDLERGQPGDAAARGARLKIVHEAINRTAGRAVFAHNLDDFLTAHPEFAPLRGDFESLFAASGRTFFGTEAARGDDEGLEDLLRLCRAGRRIERRAFGNRLPGRVRAAGN